MLKSSGNQALTHEEKIVRRTNLGTKADQELSFIQKSL
jgi:hypothetical protein